MHEKCTDGREIELKSNFFGVKSSNEFDVKIYCHEIHEDFKIMRRDDNEFFAMILKKYAPIFGSMMVPDPRSKRILTKNPLNLEHIGEGSWIDGKHLNLEANFKVKKFKMLFFHIRYYYI